MKIWFHIGYPKAGSTTLQKQFFNPHSEINFLGVYPNSNTGIDTETMDENHPYFLLPKLQDLHTSLTMDEEFNAEKKRKHLEQIINQTSSNEQVTILSNERITSVFFSYPDIDDELQRIKALGIDGILMVCRNQRDIIKSQYREHPFDPEDPVHGKPMNIDEWVQKSNELPYSYLESLQFHRVAERCVELFGKEKVIVIAFEELLKSPATVSKKLSRKFGINYQESNSLLENLPQENRGVSKRYNQVRNLKKKLMGEFPISNYIPDSIINLSKSVLKKGPKAQYSFSPETINFLNEYFSESNKKLAEDWSIKIKEYKYPIIKPS